MAQQQESMFIDDTQDTNTKSLLEHKERSKKLATLSLKEYLELAEKKQKGEKKWRRPRKKRKRTLKSRCPRTYKVYIESEWWEKRKNDYWRKYGKRCAICRSTEYVQLHHVVYRHFGSEKDEDLEALCLEHHREFHERYGISGNMKRAMHSYFADYDKEWRP